MVCSGTSWRMPVTSLTIWLQGPLRVPPPTVTTREAGPPATSRSSRIWRTP